MAREPRFATIGGMSLSLGTGPLAGQPGGAFNFDLSAAPAHRIFFADDRRRLRALIGDRVVLDTTGAKLLYETGIPPVPYVPLGDFDHDLLERTDHTTHCPFKGDASYWSVRVGDRAARERRLDLRGPAARGGAGCAGYAALYWKRADAWLVEEEAGASARLRDPYHRVDVHESSRPVTVTAGGRVVARSERPKLLFETGLAPVVYVPRADVAAGVLAPAEKRTRCPYKGEAGYWSVAGVADAAWSYEAPLPEAIKIQGHIAFDGEAASRSSSASRAAQLPQAA